MQRNRQKKEEHSRVALLVVEESSNKNSQVLVLNARLGVARTTFEFCDIELDNYLCRMQAKTVMQGNQVVSFTLRTVMPLQNPFDYLSSA